MVQHTEVIIAVTLLLIMFQRACSVESTVEIKIPDNIYSEERINGSCTVVYKHKQHKPVSCSKMMIRVKPRSPNAGTCNVTELTARDWLASGCKRDFTILCSKSNASIDLQCILSDSHMIKKIKVIPKPKIITRPINATVDRVGLPITLTCEVDGDPSHYWVGWIHKNSIIQTGDGDSYSHSTSPSLISPNGTSYHLTVHSVKAPGKYTCQVYSIEGEKLANMSHEVSFKESTSESSLFDTLFSKFFN